MSVTFLDAGSVVLMAQSWAGTLVVGKPFRHRTARMLLASSLATSLELLELFDLVGVAPAGIPQVYCGVWHRILETCTTVPVDLARFAATVLDSGADGARTSLAHERLGFSLVLNGLLWDLRRTAFRLWHSGALEQERSVAVHNAGGQTFSWWCPDQIL